jgi:Flp pilus assembly protein protease CpaA
LLSDFQKPAWRFPLVGVGIALPFLMGENTANAGLLVVAFLVWSLWELGGLGGADAKILLTLLLLIPTASLFMYVVIAGGVQGLVALLRRKASIPYTVAITLGFISWAILETI